MITKIATVVVLALSLLSAVAQVTGISSDKPLVTVVEGER